MEFSGGIEWDRLEGARGGCWAVLLACIRLSELGPESHRGLMCVGRLGRPAGVDEVRALLSGGGRLKHPRRADVEDQLRELVERGLIAVVEFEGEQYFSPVVLRGASAKGRELSVGPGRAGTARRPRRRAETGKDSGVGMEPSEGRESAAVECPAPVADDGANAPAADDQPEPKPPDPGAASAQGGHKDRTGIAEGSGGGEITAAAGLTPEVCLPGGDNRGGVTGFGLSIYIEGCLVKDGAAERSASGPVHIGEVLAHSRGPSPGARGNQTKPEAGAGLDAGGTGQGRETDWEQGRTKPNTAWGERTSPASSEAAYTGNRPRAPGEGPREWEPPSRGDLTKWVERTADLTGDGQSLGGFRKWITALCQTEAGVAAFFAIMRELRGRLAAGEAISAGSARGRWVMTRLLQAMKDQGRLPEDHWMFRRERRPRRGR